uniref:Uncharacterized protein n=1 Tax=Meloidogyne incognita TaxID=6306 RepID=A0A914M0K1_MELIC
MQSLRPHSRAKYTRTFKELVGAHKHREQSQSTLGLILLSIKVAFKRLRTQRSRTHPSIRNTPTKTDSMCCVH